MQDEEDFEEVEFDNRKGSNEEKDSLIEDDEISAAEEGFMRGYEEADAEEETEEDDEE